MMRRLQVQPSMMKHNAAQEQHVSLVAIDKRTVHEQ